MTIWKALLDSLDTPGGHIWLLFLLVMVGVGLAWLKVPKGEDILIGSFGALLGALRGATKNG